MPHLFLTLTLAFVCTTAFALPAPASAFFGSIVQCGQPCANGQGIVPCTTCDIVALIQNIIRFFIFAATAIAVLLFVYAGVLMVTAMGDMGKLATARSIFSNVLIGFIITLTAWLVIDTIMKVFYNQSTIGQPWNQIICPSNNPSTACETIAPPAASEFLPPGYERPTLPPDPNAPAPPPNYTNNSANVCPQGPGEPCLPPPSSGVRELNYGLLPDERRRQIQEALEANGMSRSIPPELIAAIIQQESGGRPGAISPAGAAGLMQVMPATARDLNPMFRNMTDDQIRTALTNNPQLAIQTGVAYAAFLYRHPNVNGNLERLAAAYNGGPGSSPSARGSPPLAPSRDCPSGPAYACPINPGGLAETRQYVSNVAAYCGRACRPSTP